MKRIAILGTGISGLATAWYLKKKYKESIELTLFEKSERPGGWMRTVNKEGFLFEMGPRGFRPAGKGKVTLELIQDLGLTNQLISSDPRARHRFLYLNGRLQVFSPYFLLKQGLLRAIWKDLTLSASSAEDETISAFTQRRLNQDLLETCMDPLTRGIYGGDTQKLSMRSCFPLFWKAEKQKGSIIRGILAERKREKPPASLYSFREGMETLPKCLAACLETHLVFSHDVASLTNSDADCIISTLPASELARILGIEDPLEYATLSLIHCGWNRHVLKRHGYGFLIPSKEDSEVLGMTWDSEIFPQLSQGCQTRLCIMVSGEKTEGELQKLALSSLHHYLGISSKPEVFCSYVAKNAIPQYTLHYHRRLAEFKRQLPAHVYPLGHSFEGVGLNECIFNARKLVRDLSI